MELTAAKLRKVFMNGCYLFAVVSDHGPHQLVPAVKLVLHLKEGEPEKTEDHWLLGDFYLTGGLSKRSFPLPVTAAQPNVFKTQERGSVSLKDNVIHVSQCRPNTFQQQVEGLKRCRFLSRVVAAGAQRQAEVELNADTHRQ